MFKLQLFPLCVCYFSILFAMSQGEYVAPSTIEYPFGDEVYNADMKDDRAQQQFESVDVETIKDIYVFCPNVTEEEDVFEEIPYSDSECTKCDIRPTVDKKGALVECYNCTEISMMTIQTEVPSSHILFLTTYLEIANYTHPLKDI